GVRVPAPGAIPRAVAVRETVAAVEEALEPVARAGRAALREGVCREVSIATHGAVVVLQDAIQIDVLAVLQGEERLALHHLRVSREEGVRGPDVLIVFV